MMKGRNLVVLIAVCLLFLAKGVCFAGNPADLTVFYRYSPVGFGQFEADNHGEFFYLAQPISERLSLEYMDWQGEGCRLIEGSFAYKASDILQIGLVRDDYSNSRPQNYLMADYTTGDVALGVLAPTDGNAILFGPRWKPISGLTLVATLGEGIDPSFGAVLSAGKATWSLAASEDMVDVRISECNGKTLPELRLRKMDDNYTYGASIGFMW